MRNIKSILAFILALTFANIYAHKVRIEKPQSFKFTFENKEVVKLNASDSKLKMFC
ncbi:putative ion transporter superfamily protein YfcC, partial [Flavobacterium sp. CAN_S2]